MLHSPSLSTEMRQILAFNSLENCMLISARLEPLIRTVVREEVQRCLVLGSCSHDKQALMRVSPEVPLYQLTFKCQPQTPIFAGVKIRDLEGNPLQILLAGPTGLLCSFPSPIKIDLVVLDGDFPAHDDWTHEEFEKAILKERTGRRPLLAGEVSNITMRDGVVTIGELQFTDNSSWTRSRHFRIGARMVPRSYERTIIKETITERFTVKDHRAYQKHNPPVLTDEVWRLEKIGKNGAFHNKLFQNNIKNIQDFLKLWTVDAGRLRQILHGMTEKTWERVINHALKCDLGDKMYCYSSNNVMIYINSICQVQLIKVGDVLYTSKDLPKNCRNRVLNLVQEAYQQWDSLMEADDFDVKVALIQSQSVGQGGAGTVQWYPNSSQESGIIEFKDTDEGSSSDSFQFDQVSSMEWSHDFNQML